MTSAVNRTPSTKRTSDRKGERSCESQMTVLRRPTVRASAASHAELCCAASGMCGDRLQALVSPHHGTGSTSFGHLPARNTPIASNTIIGR